MTRLSPRVVQQAARINCYLPVLLRECRDLRSTKNEFRWIKQHLDSEWKTSHPGSYISETRKGNVLKHYIHRRARGEPLQYLLGTQPFGDLEILCEPNVLIPRPETETYTTLLGQTIARLRANLEEATLSDGSSLIIADFCTGSGCIALSLHCLLRLAQQEVKGRHSDGLTTIQIYGYDISSHALNLAERNKKHNLDLGLLHETAVKEVVFAELDVLALGQKSTTKTSEISPTHVDQDRSRKYDIIVSNPPYISPKDFKAGGSTTRSVRKYEPQLALVPPKIDGSDDLKQADQFYDALLEIAFASSTKLLVMEIGDNQQAARVRQMVQQKLKQKYAGSDLDQQYLIETWRDDGSVSLDLAPASDIDASIEAVHDRAIVLWLGKWMEWRTADTSEKSRNFKRT